ncbi:MULTISPECIES: nitroreductase family protein [unclassified Paenibacillus]|uniref:nitroreductase family protein n=1 Tax=unclassified Paenibacillus TaxID=185978 RepID=UPI0030F6F72F
MKDVSTTVRERRTIRRFSAAPVEQERIISLIKEAAGLYESEDTPHWRCLYFGTPESREELAESMMAKVTGGRLGKLLPARMTDLLRRQITGTPAHVIFIAESAGTERERDENYAAVCSIMQTVQLLGWEQGLGMLWYTDPLILSESFYKLIGWREGERFAGILEIGSFDKAPRGRKRTPAERKWTIIGEDSRQLEDAAPFSAYNVLRLLNEAVWAPNDGMREPWRFIYVTGDKTEASGKLQFSEEALSPPFLLVVAREETDAHKQDEDYAAVCSLIQNFQLLARSEGWQLRRRIPEWVYDRKQCESFGLRPLERIVAVLEAGEHKRYSNSVFPIPAVKITIN